MEAKSTTEKSAATSSKSSSKLILIIIPVLVIGLCVVFSAVAAVVAFGLSRDDKDSDKKDDKTSESNKKDDNKDSEESNNDSDSDNDSNNDSDSDSDESSSDEDPSYFDLVQGGKLPSDLPKDIPLYKNYDKVLSSSKNDYESSTNIDLALILESADTSKLYAELKELSLDMGWEITSDSNYSESYTLSLSMDDDMKSLTITIVNDIYGGDTATIVYNYTEYK